MHDYAGNPATFALAASIPDDGVDTPSFAVIENPVLTALDRTAWLKDQLSRQLTVQALGNFNPSIVTITGPGGAGALNLGAVAWDAQYQRWAGLFQGVTGMFSYDTHDSGNTWTNLNSAIITGDYGLAGASDGNGLFTALINGGTVVGTVQTTAFGSTFGPTTQAFLGNLVQAVMFFFTPFWFLFGCQQSGTTYTGKLAASSTGTGAWTNDSSTLPASWQTGTSTIAGFISATDPTALSTYTVMVGMCGTTPGTDVSRILGLGTGGPPTDITPAFLTGKCLTGMAYNAELGLWGILCYDTTTYLYTSPDQVTWTLTHTFDPSAGAIQSGGLAVVGAVWAAHLGVVDGGTFVTNPGGRDRLMLSADGGATWGTASMNLGGFGAAGAGNAYQFPRLISNGNQLLAYNNVNHAFSQVFGQLPQGAY